MKPLQVRVPDSLLAQVDEAAEDAGVTRAAWVINALELALKTTKPQKFTTRAKLKQSGFDPAELPVKVGAPGHCPKCGWLVSRGGKCQNKTCAGSK